MMPPGRVSVMDGPWMMRIADWEDRWRGVSEAIDRLDGGHHMVPLSIGPPASEAQVEQVEQELGRRLPESLRATLRACARVDFGWYVDDDSAWPPELEGVTAGWCRWDIDRLVELDRARESWARDLFPNVDDPYDRVWHNKTAVQRTQYGDYLAVDNVSGAVVFLSHDEGEEHGYELGTSFADFVDRWTRVCCIGPAGWMFLPFVSAPSSGIQPECENARRLRAWIGLESD